MTGDGIVCVYAANSYTKSTFNFGNDLCLLGFKLPYQRLNAIKGWFIVLIKVMGVVSIYTSYFIVLIKLMGVVSIYYRFILIFGGLCYYYGFK